MRDQENQASVREYFSRLALTGKTRAVIAEWASLSVDSFFVALKLPGGMMNRERKACGTVSQTLTALFSNVQWNSH